MTRFELAINKQMICEFCGITESVKEYRRLTQYADDNLNWVIACDECMAKDNEYYKERWDEYNSSRI
jgi:hypothetical protein